MRFSFLRSVMMGMCVIVFRLFLSSACVGYVVEILLLLLLF